MDMMAIVRDLTAATRNEVFAVSGNRCAFPGCDEPMVVRDGSGASQTVGEIAHIVAASRRGPRGVDTVPEDRRNHADNLVALCRNHHRLVDQDPLTYTVPVLREMRRLHVSSVEPDHAGVEPSVELVDEELVVTALPIEAVPSRVFHASATIDSPREVIARIRSTRTGPVSPFILRDGRIWTFDNLTRARNRYSTVIDGGDTESLASDALWDTDDNTWRYVDLLNRTLKLYLERSRIGFDPQHRRYYYWAPKPVASRQVSYTTKAGRNRTSSVVFQRTRAGVPVDEWWHWAAGMRFQYLGRRRWVLSIRPEYHVTRDGHEPFDSKRVGRRVTRRKSHQYNREYFDRVWFWVQALTANKPQVMIPVGDQALLIGAELMTCTVRSPGVAIDESFATREAPDDDLFSYGDLIYADGFIEDDE